MHGLTESNMISDMTS